MAQTNVNIRMEENLKKQFDNLCNELGLTMTTVKYDITLGTGE